MANCCAAASPSARSMAWRVSPLVRWTMPPLIVVTTALFIVAHCVVIDTEMIDIKLRGAAEGAGDTTVLHLNVWDFQLKNTVRMMWDSGAWPLAILVVSMSVAWVYAKMIMMMVVWFAPLSRAAAGRLLLLLDLLGKWSFIDLFVALLYQDGLSLQLRRVMQVGDASIGLHSRGGAYVFLSALVVAIAITQVEVAIHRQSSGGEESATTARRDPSVERCFHLLTRPPRTACLVVSYPQVSSARVKHKRRSLLTSVTSAAAAQPSSEMRRRRRRQRLLSRAALRWRCAA